MARVGTAYLQIVASLRGVRQIQREVDRGHYTVKITPELDSKRFTSELNALLRDRTVTVNVNLDTAKATSQLQTAFRNQIATVNADADTGMAEAKLARVARDRKVEVKVDVDRGFDRAVAAGEKFGSTIGKIAVGYNDVQAGIGRVSNSFVRFSGQAALGVGKIGVGLAGVGLGLQGVAQLAQAAAGAIALLPAALGAAAAAGGVLALGLHGIGDAAKAGWTQANTSATKGAAAARASADRIVDAQNAVSKAVESRNRSVADADRGLKSAEQAVGQAVADAAKRVETAQAAVGRAVQARTRSVESAERALVAAQVGSQRAQERLTLAREDATEKLRDMRGELEHAEAGEEGAAISLARALERQAQVNADLTATELDKREARFGVAEAENAVEDAARASAKARQEHVKAQAEGVEGSKEVVAATREVSDASDGVRDAERKLREERADGTAAVLAARREVTEAEIEGRKQVSEANVRVANEERQLQQAQADGTLAIAEASRNLAQAQAAQAEAATTEANKFSEAMARLSPNARELVQTILGLKPAFDGLRLDVQDRLLAGVSGHFRSLATLYLPILQTHLGGIADGFNAAFLKMSLFFEQGPQVQRFSEAMGNIRTAVDTISRTLQPLTEIFFTLFATGSGYLAPLVGYFEQLFTVFNQFLQSADKSGALDAFFQMAITSLITIFKIVEDVIVIFSQLFGAISGAGLTFLDVLSQLTGMIRDFFASAEGQTALKALFEFLSKIIAAVLPVVMELINAVLHLLLPLFEALGPPIATVVKMLADALLPVIKVLGTALEQMMTTLGPLLQALADLLGEIFKALSPILQDVIQIVGNVLTQVFAELTPVIKALVPLFGEVARVLGNFFVAGIRALAPLLPVLAEALADILMALIPLIPPLLKIVEACFTPLLQLLPALVPLIRLIAEVFVALAPAILSLVEVLAVVLIPLLNFLGKLITDVFTAIVTVIVWCWQTITIPLIKNVLVPVIQWLAGIFIWFQVNVVQPVFKAIGDFIGWVWENLIKPAWTSMQTMLGDIGKFFEDTWNNVIKPAWNALGDGINWVWVNVIKPTWDTMAGALQGLSDFFSGAVAGIGLAWSGLQNLLKDPINWVINEVWNKGFGGFWKAADALFGGALTDWVDAPLIGAAAAAPQFSAGTGRGASTFGLATGGVLPGYAPGRDSILAMLSPGEAVMRPEWARAVGKKDIDRMNKAARKGGTAAAWNVLYGGDAGSPPIIKQRKPPLLSGYQAGGVVVNPGVERGLAFARSMSGRAIYTNAFVSQAGSDCSGFMSQITNAALNRPPHKRLFTTSSFGPGRGAGGFIPGLKSAFTIGVVNGFPMGHMAGTIGGQNVESGGGHGPELGGRAVGSTNRQFTMQFHLPEIGGQFVPGPDTGGGGSFDIGAVIAGWIAQFLDPVKQSINNLFGGGSGIKTFPGAVVTSGIKGVTDFVTKKAAEMGIGGVGTGATSNEAPGIVKIIADVARGRFGAAARQAAIVGVATGLVESNLANLGHGDRDSVGVFQQRPSQGWGSISEIMNVTYAAGKFFEKFPGNWASMEPGALAQSVQRSAFPFRYAQRMGQATGLVAQFGGFDGGGVLPPGLTLAFNGTHRPERVLTDTQWQAMSAATQGGDFRITSGELEIVGDGMARIIDARLERVGTAIDRGRRV